MHNTYRRIYNNCKSKMCTLGGTGKRKESGRRACNRATTSIARWCVEYVNYGKCQNVRS